MTATACVEYVLAIAPAVAHIEESDEKSARLQMFERNGSDS